MGLPLLLLLILSAPAAAQESEFAARLASAVAVAAAQASTPPVVVAIEPSEQAGLGEQAARWLRVEQFLWAELARGATVVPVLPGGEAPRLRLRTAASGLPEGFLAQWRLHDAASGRLLQSDSARWGDPPPPPAAETAVSTTAPMALATPPAVMTVMSWLDRPMFDGLVHSPVPVWAGGGILGGQRVSGVGAWAAVRDRAQKWEGALEFDSWSGKHSGPANIRGSGFTGAPYLLYSNSSANLRELRILGARTFVVPFGLGVPGVAWMDFPLFLRPTLGVGLQNRAVDITSCYRVGGGGVLPLCIFERQDSTRVMGTAAVFLGKRFRQDIEVLGGWEYFLGRSNLDPAEIAPRVRWSIRAQLRLF